MNSLYNWNSFTKYKHYLIFNTQAKRRSDICVSMRPENLELGVDVNSKKLPTVFKWDGGGKSVSVSGSFDNWTRQIPMVKRFLSPYWI